jgi:hypothetical protein
MGLEQWADLTTQKKENKISEESARAELKRLCSHYDVDMSEIVSEQEIVVDKILLRLLNAFQSGQIELKQDNTLGFCIVQNCIGDKDLTFRELKGSDKLKLDTFGENPNQRLHQLAGLLCGCGADIIGKLAITDLKITEAISGFFCVLA